MPFFDPLIRRLTATPVPAAAFHVTSDYLGGLRCVRKTGLVKNSFYRTLPAGMIKPSFDKPNLLQPEAFQAVLKDAVRRLGMPEGPVALFLSEICVKTALLAFDSLPTSPAECEKVVRWRLAKTLPLRPAETRLSFAVHRVDGRAKAFCALAAETVVREYEQVFEKAGLNVRMIGLPTPALLGCLPKNGGSNYLIFNVENEYFAALAVLDGEPALFRVKPLTQGSAWAESADEVANTLRFIEDREKKHVDTIWLRPAAAGDAETGAALFQKRASCPVRILPGDAPAGIPPADKIHLAPLLGGLA